MKSSLLKVLKYNVSIGVLIIACVFVLIASKEIPSENKVAVVNVPDGQGECPYYQEKLRINTNSLVQPLLLSDLNIESETYLPLKNKIEKYLNQIKTEHQADNVSIYFQRLNNGSWFCINPDQKYYPASMRKIIYLVTYLKEAEKEPGILNKKLLLKKHFPQDATQNKRVFTLKENENYLVSDLLTAMIKINDFDATNLLKENVNKNIYNQLFSDLKIPNPPDKGDYFITISDYSKIFRVLYNATYIRPEFSEYAMKLLTESNYNDGLREGVDQNIAVAHKMGEHIVENKQQFHEFGIIYIKGDPYLLGVMTIGQSQEKLSGIIKEVSRITYSEFQNFYHS